MLPLALHKASSFLQSMIQIKKGSKETLVEDIKLEELDFSGSQLYTKPSWKQHSTDLQDMSFLMPFQSLLFNHWASKHTY